MKKTALITGGTRGIGRAIAEKLGEQGFDLAVNGVRDENQVSEVLQQLRKTGAEVIYCQGDVGSMSGRKAILEQLKNQFGHINVLVNNAGVAPKERLDPLKATEESFERVMRINLQGPYFLTQAIAEWMIDSTKKSEAYFGTVINVGSISATVVSIMRGEYCISKAGFGMHSKIWAVRLAEYGIPVYEVRPGITQTDMTAAVQKKYDKLIADGLTVQPRWGMPDDVAKAVLALANGDFPYSTGEVFMVDGGLTTQRL